MQGYNRESLLEIESKLLMLRMFSKILEKKIEKRKKKLKFV